MEESVDFLIRSHYAKLRNSEKKVADVVLKQGSQCQKMTIERLAQQSGVSQPTVMRFVKAVGFQSYREFQDALLCQDMKTRMKPGEGGHTECTLRVSASFGRFDGECAGKSGIRYDCDAGRDAQKYPGQ